MVGLVQTLSGLPVFLLIIPAGALADLVDRRRLLLFAQSWMFVAAALLGWLTADRLVGAIKAGIRYTRYSRPLTAVLFRAGAFVVGANAVPALLPLYAATVTTIARTAL
jgi:MFS family permease